MRDKTVRYKCTFVVYLVVISMISIMSCVKKKPTEPAVKQSNSFRLDRKDTVDGNDSTLVEQKENDPGALHFKTTVRSTGLPARIGFEMVEFQGMYWFMGGETADQSNAVHNDIWNSIDGVNWNKVVTQAAWSGRSHFNLFEFNNALWIIGGENHNPAQLLNDVWKSNDGVTWIRVTQKGPWPTRKMPNVTVQNNKMYLIGGHTTAAWTVYQDIWESGDGVNWKKVGEISDALLNTVETRHGIWQERVVKLNQTYFLLGGNLSTSFYAFPGVLKSRDMVNWQLATRQTPWKDEHYLGMRNLRPLVVHDRIFVVMQVLKLTMGKRKSILFSSHNGISWKQEVELPSFVTNFSARAIGYMDAPRMLSINNKICVFGAYDASIVYQTPDTETHLVELSLK